MLDSWTQDVRYAARMVRRNPIFSLTAAMSLAIGIGANTTIFTVANALLFRPPAGVADPDRLVDIGRSQGGSGFDTNSYPNYLDIRSRTSTLSGVYAYRLDPQAMSLGGENGAERIYGEMVTANYFSVLGARPALGRLFLPEDSEQPGASPLIVLSHRTWKRRFNGDPAVLGRTVDVNGRPFTIVGVAAEGFHGTTIITSDVWLPMSMVGTVSPRMGDRILTSRESVWLVMGGRLKPGVSVRQAQADLDRVGGALVSEFPDANRGRGVRVLPSAPIPGNSAPVAAFLGVLMGIVALVLAIACVNVAGVLVARAATRRREIAVRLAIGAGRARLIRQMLVETAVLFLIGATAGLALARAVVALLVATLPALPFPIDLTMPVNGRAVAFTAALSLLAAALSGLAPAFHASNGDVLSGLRGESTAVTATPRLRSALLVSQVAFSIVLVVAAGLFARALHRAASIDPGFDPGGIELASLDFSLGGYTDQTGPMFASDLIDGVRRLPGVESAALSAMVPLGDSGLGLGGLTVPGITPPRGERYFEADWDVVSPGYFSMMKIPLVAGRDFGDTDRAPSPYVMIVNETAARRWWPGESPLGKTILQQDDGPGQPDRMRPLTIIGVARDSKYRSLGEAPRAFVYVPYSQQYISRATIMARAAGGRRLASELRAFVTERNRNLPVVSTQSFEEYASVALVPQRVAASIAGTLGIIGLLLAAMGIYGVTALIVSSRTREIGIRMALGARRATVVRLVLRQGLTLGLAGIVVGLAIAAGASRFLASFLLGIGPTDPIAFIGAATLFGIVSAAACYVPVRRATEIDPMQALRHD